MRKFVTIIGYITIAFVIYLFGYYVGAEPTEEELISKQAEDEIVADVFTLTEKYEEIYNTCESKYQAVIKGDYTTAYQDKGRQDKIFEDINEILYKYTDDTSNRLL